MLFIGSDHAGYEMKERLKKILDKKVIQYEDVGTFDAKSCSYPEIAKILCEKIYDEDKGILICGTGLGMSMVANRYPHIRAGLCTKINQAEMARRHNNANVLVLQGRNKCAFVNKKILNKFLSTDFDGGRHLNRIEQFSEKRIKIEEEPIENKENK